MSAAGGTAQAARLDLGRLSPRDVARVVDVAAVLARHGLVVVARHGTTIVVRPVPAGGKALTVALRRSFADLGPTFVKLGQLVASSPSLFPPALSEECRRLLDRVPAEPAAHVRATIARELGAPAEVLFAAFDPVPIAAASIAQVHAARLHDGRKVAVKVRRPRLRQRIATDLRLLRILAAAASRSGALGRAANPVAVIEDFATTLVGELDLRREAAAMTRFAANLATSPDRDAVVVPAVVDDLATERVLVMDFVPGRPIDEVAAAGGADLRPVLSAAVRVWLEGVLVHGFFHGDVHAGNLFVTPEGKAAFLDFGITGAVSAASRAALAELLPAVLVTRDFRRAVAALFDLGAATGPVDVEAASRDVETLVTPLLARPLGEIVYGEVLDDVLAVATRHRVRLPAEMVLLVKQLLYFERYAKAIAPDHHLLTDPSLLAVLQRA